MLIVRLKMNAFVEKKQNNRYQLIKKTQQITKKSTERRTKHKTPDEDDNNQSTSINDTNNS